MTTAKNNNSDKNTYLKFYDKNDNEWKISFVSIAAPKFTHIHADIYIHKSWIRIAHLLGILFDIYLILLYRQKIWKWLWTRVRRFMFAWKQLKRCKMQDNGQEWYKISENYPC